MQVRDCTDRSDEAAALCGEITTNKSEAGSCILPPFPEHGAYTTDIAGAELGQGYERVTVSNVTCERGYDARGSASREFSCSHGVWTGSVPRCVFTWLDANKTCVAEGARLAVANSAAEERAPVELYQRYPKEAILDTRYTSAVYVGIYLESGTWRTVDGQTLAQAGHAHWAPASPSLQDRYPYGAMARDGTLYNMRGSDKRAFICEMALWT